MEKWCGILAYGILRRRLAIFLLTRAGRGRERWQERGKQHQNSGGTNSTATKPTEEQLSRERANRSSSLNFLYLGEKVTGEARHHRRLYGRIPSPPADHGAASHEAGEVGLVDVERLACLLLPDRLNSSRVRIGHHHRQGIHRSCRSRKTAENVVSTADISFNLSRCHKHRLDQGRARHPTKRAMAPTELFTTIKGSRGRSHSTPRHTMPTPPHPSTPAPILHRTHATPIYSHRCEPAGLDLRFSFALATGLSTLVLAAATVIATVAVLLLSPGELDHYLTIVSEPLRGGRCRVSIVEMNTERPTGTRKTYDNRVTQAEQSTA